MGIVTGVVEQAQEKNQYGKTSVKINGTYYSTKAEWFKGKLPNVGDTVSFDDGGGKFIKGVITVTSASNGAAPPASGGKSSGYTESNDRQASIERQCALKSACDLIATQGITKSEDADAIAGRVIEVADRLYAYTSGALEQMKEDALLGNDDNVPL